MFATYCRLNVHVRASDRDVIRAASRRLRPGHRFAHTSRDARHRFHRDMLACHRQARAIAIFVG